MQKKEYLKAIFFRGFNIFLRSPDVQSQCINLGGYPHANSFLMIRQQNYF